MGNEIISDPDSVLYAWKDHFEALGRSRKEVDDVAAAEMRAEALFSESYTNMETILDFPFQQEELENALKKLRNRLITVGLQQNISGTEAKTSSYGFYKS